MDYYAEYKNNLTSKKGEDILLNKALSLDKEVVKIICKQFKNFEDDIRDLVVFLRNNMDFSPIEVIQYLKYLFDMPLNKASVLYQEYTPEKNDTQSKFKITKKDTSLLQENVLFGARETLKTLINPITIKILFILKEKTVNTREICTVLDLSQSTVVLYLRKMKKIDLIISQKSGNHIYFSLNQSNFDRITSLVKEITESKEAAVSSSKS